MLLFSRVAEIDTFECAYREYNGLGVFFDNLVYYTPRLQLCTTWADECDFLMLVFLNEGKYQTIDSRQYIYQKCIVM